MILKLGNWEFTTGQDTSAGSASKGSGSAPLVGSQIRDSFSDPILNAYKQYVVLNANLQLYEVIRESMPFIDIAIIKLIRLIGDFDFETFGNMDLKRRLLDFRNKIIVNHYGLGLDDFIYQMADSTFGFGYGVGELIPTRTLGGIERLKTGDSKTFCFKKEKNRLQLVQQIAGEFVEVPMRDNIFYLAFDKRNGHPQGYSLLYSLVYPAQVLTRIQKSVENAWWRIGDPSFTVMVNGGDKSNAEQVKKAADDIKGQFMTLFQNRRQGKPMDLFGGAPHGGKVEVKILGADFTFPDIKESVRFVTEQLVAKTGLPPFMMGLSWSTTERMSKDQNDMIVADTNYRRLQLDPIIDEIIETFLILNGDAGAKWKKIWKPVNLLDVLEQARGRYFEAFAMEKELLNYESMIMNGWIDEDEVVDRIRNNWRNRKGMRLPESQFKIPSNGKISKADVKKLLAQKKKQYAKRILTNTELFN